MNARNSRGDFKLSRSMNVREEMYWMNLTQSEYFSIIDNQSKAYAEGFDAPQLPSFVTNEADIRQEVRDEYVGYGSISRQRQRVIPVSVVVSVDGELERPILKRYRTISIQMKSFDLWALVDKQENVECVPPTLITETETQASNQERTKEEEGK